MLYSSRLVRRRILVLVIVLFVVGTGVAGAQEIKPAHPTEKDKCPICGMFVYKYPDWLAQIIFKDGSVRFFDGPKDLFKYYLNIQEHDPGKNRQLVAAVFVREYYDLQFIDARKARFVVGSDVYGPMGHELIPLATLDDARVFMKDHKGRKILLFEKITPQMVRTLDLGPREWSWMGGP